MPATTKNVHRWHKGLIDALRELWHGVAYFQVVTRRGRRYFVSQAAATHARAMFGVIAERRFAAARGQTPRRLISLRDDFRRVARPRPQHLGVLFMWMTDRDLEVARLAVWLLGRTRAKVAVPEIAAYRSHADVRLRREVARATTAQCLGRAASDCGDGHGSASDSPGNCAAAKALERKTRSHAAHNRYRAATHTPATLCAVADSDPAGRRNQREMIRALLERIRRRIRGL